MTVKARAAAAAPDVGTAAAEATTVVATLAPTIWALGYRARVCDTFLAGKEASTQTQLDAKGQG
eukprot:8827416-Lingulodinium_polyedra.AAC.1